MALDLLLNNAAELATVHIMKKPYAFPLAVVLVLVLSGPGFAACFADYKAKRDKPLRLHYGVIELSDAVCDDPGGTQAEISRRIDVDNWDLLTVMSTFGRGGLEQRQKNAGEFFLRY